MATINVCIYGALPPLPTTINFLSTSSTNYVALVSMPPSCSIGMPSIAHNYQELVTPPQCAPFLFDTASVKYTKHVMYCSEIRCLV